MATFAELTPEEKQVLQDWTGQLRAWSGEQARVNNHGQALLTAHTAQASAILAKLDAGEKVPNRSGLSGSQELTVVEINDLVADVNAIDNSDSFRQLASKAAGSSNLNG